jgi:hypothetical protein
MSAMQPSSCRMSAMVQVLDQLVSDILRSIHLVHKLVNPCLPCS